MHPLLALSGAVGLLASPVLGDEFMAPLYDFLSRPDIHASRISVSHYDPHGVAPGYLFLTPWAPEVQRGTNFDFGPAIYDNNGELIWTGSNSSERTAGTQVFFMTEIDGEPALGYYHLTRAYDTPMATVLDKHYHVKHNVHVVDTAELTWSAESEGVNGLVGEGSFPTGDDLHDLFIVTRPARTEAWPAAGIDPVDEIFYDRNGNQIRRRRSDAPAGSRRTTRKVQTTALMTFGRINAMKDPFHVCKQKMNYVHSSGFQEISLDGTNTLLFQWDPAEHIPINETAVCGGDWDHGDQHASSIGRHDWHPFDFFHRNSIDKDENGDYYLSARHTRTIYKLSGEDGSIIWRLGGVNSDFKHVSEVPGVQFDFAWQHDARLADDLPGADFANGIIGMTMWDNANNIYDESMKTADYSAGKSFLIDQNAMKATLVQAYTLPGRPLGVNQGSHQVLPNGNHIIGGGNIGMVAEYRPAPNRNVSEADPSESPMGELVFAAHYGAGPMNSYRGKRYDWHGYPTDAPALFGYARGCPGEAADTGSAYYYMSWNGATEIASWAMFGSSHPKGPFEKIAEHHRTGFETTIKGRFAGYTYAVAYDINRKELGGSEVTRTWVPSESYVDHGLGDASRRHRSRREQIVLDGGSCSTHRCAQHFRYKWTRAMTCPGLDPIHPEMDRISDGWTAGGWHIVNKTNTVSVTKTYTKGWEPPTPLAELESKASATRTRSSHPTADSKLGAGPAAVAAAAETGAVESSSQDDEPNPEGADSAPAQSMSLSTKPHSEEKDTAGVRHRRRSLS